MWDCYFLRNILALIFIVASAGVMAIVLYWQEIKPVRNRCQEVWTYSKKYPVSAFTNTLLGILIFVFVVLFYGWLYPFIVILYDAIELQIDGVTIGTPAFRNVSLSVAGSITLSIAVLGVILTVIRNILTRQQNRTDEERLVAEQISRAIEQIGAYRQSADGEILGPNIEVRLGGLYSFQRIMEDSPRDSLPIARIIYAYVRENAKRVRVKKEGLKYVLLPEDIDSVLNIINQFNKEWKKRFGERPNDSQLNFSGADFAGYDLVGVDFSNAILKYAYFTNANLSDANFTNADLSCAILYEAHLYNTNFTNARLSGAILAKATLPSAKLLSARLVTTNLEGADLSSADLSGADLAVANLEGANLSGADLYHAVLSYADLSGADLSEAHNLTQEQINEAEGDEDTKLPNNLIRPESWKKD